MVCGNKNIREAHQRVPEETLFIIKAINPWQSHFTMTKQTRSLQKLLESVESSALKQRWRLLKLCFRTQSQPNVKKLEERMIYKRKKSMNCVVHVRFMQEWEHFFGNGNRCGKKRPERLNISLFLMKLHISLDWRNTSLGSQCNFNKCIHLFVL